MKNHLNQILERLPKEEFTPEMEAKDFQRLVDKYTSMKYINIFDILYDYIHQIDLRRLCFERHGMNEEEVQIILQDFINDGLIYPVSNLDSVPSLTKLGFSIYCKVKSIHKNHSSICKMLSNDFNKCSDLNFPIPAAELRGIKPKEIKISIDDNNIKLIFLNCPHSIAFLKKYPILNLLDLLLSLEPNEVTLELKYQSKAMALDVFNSFKDRVELFSNES